MNVSLYQAAAALSANSRWQDVVSENLASSSVNGFRKQSLSTAAVKAGLMPTPGAHGTGKPDFFSLPQTHVGVSFKSGEMDFTGNNMNIGIEGSGFIPVQLSDGTPAVTRDGEFQMDGKGMLVTKEGYTVIGDSGPIKMDVRNHDTVTISATGEIRQGNSVKGKLTLTDFENPELLKQTNGVYFIATDPKLKAIDATGSIKDGFVEGSNTTALGEMANMMTAMRTFEANQHVIQIQDDRMGKVISELGNPAS